MKFQIGLYNGIRAVSRKRGVTYGAGGTWN